MPTYTPRHNTDAIVEKNAAAVTDLLAGGTYPVQWAATLIPALCLELWEARERIKELEDPA